MGRAAQRVAGLVVFLCLLSGWSTASAQTALATSPFPDPAPVNQPPAAPPGDFAMTPQVPSGVAVGRTRGSFAVSPTGQSTYIIPILTPRGIAGLTPSLSLSYSSGSGDGMYGVGWSVTGFSAVTRCAKTYAQDGISANIFLTTADLYCLDGNKLRSFAGTTYGADGAQYQTELANFSLVISHGTAGTGPAWFEVHGKNGLIYQYGNTSDSALIATGTTSVITWALNRITDRFGNHIDFSYTNDATNQVLRPATITYTTPPSGASGVQAQANYQVQFAYVSRTSPVPGGFVSGAQFMEPYLAQTITVAAWNGSAYAAARTYTFTYTTGTATGRSTLHTIQECSPTQCFSPTTVGYQSGQTGWASGVSIGGASNGLWSAFVGDLNGDGIDDVVYADKTTGHLYYLLGSTSGTYAGPYDTGITGAAVPIDFNGDGKMDLMVVNSSGNLRIMYYQSPGGAFTYTDTTTPAPANFGTGYVMVGDVDGDGRDDLIYAVSSGSSWTSPDYIYYRRNTGGAFGAQTLLAQIGASNCFTTGNSCQKLLNNPFGEYTRYNSRVRRTDFNGDGRTDFFVDIESCVLNDQRVCASPSYAWNLAVSDASSDTYDFLGVLSYGATGLASNLVPPLIGDFNGDGCSDVATNEGGYWVVRYGTCLRSGSAYALSAPVNTGVSASGIYPMAIDWDGDGRDDIVSANAPSGGYIGYLHSTGTGFGSWTSTGIPYNNADTQQYAALVVDVHGDGQYGIVYPTGSGYALTAFPHNGTGITQDLATSFADGFGFTYSPTYAQITNSTYYTKNTGAAYPEQDYQAADTVVASYTISDGVTAGGTYTVSQFYGWARTNIAGRGFEGFGYIRSLDSRTGLYTYNYYSLPFPETGMLSETDISGNNLYAQIINTNTSSTLDATYKRYFPYVSQSQKLIYELGGTLEGTLITQATTTYTYAGPNGFAYGNPSQIATTTVDKDPTSPWPGSTFTDTINITPYEVAGTSSTGWCIHLANEVDETRTQPGGASLTHKTSYTVNNQSQCELDDTIVESSSTTGDKVTSSYNYDACGNPTVLHVVGQNPDGTNTSVRGTSSSYGSHCIFPETITNALSQSTTNGYRYDLGLLTSTKDPNQLTTSWTYNDIGQKTLEQRPDGTETAYSLTACASYCNSSTPLEYYLTIQQKDATASHVTYWTGYKYNDQLDRTILDEATQSNGQLAIVQSLYDSLGRLSQKSNPYGNGFSEFFTTYNYDLKNRVSSVSSPTDATHPTLKYTYYTYQGRTQTVKDPKGYITTNQSDVLGELSIVTDPDGTSKTNYSYNPFGQLALIQDPAGNQTNRTFDALGYLLTATSDPDRGAWTFQYDSLGELLNLRDAKTTAPAWTQQLTYDALGRTLTRTEAEGTTTWTWGTSAGAHEIGQLSGLSGLGDTETYTFDSAGRPYQRSMVWGGPTYTVTYTYNTLGRLDQLVYPLAPGQANPFAVKYGYSNGYLSSLQNYTGGVGGTTFWTLTPSVVNMDPWGHVVDETLGTTSAVRIQSAFDAVTSWVNSRTVGSGGNLSNLDNLQYQWDLNGNLSQRHDVTQSVTETINYDNLNRIQNSTAYGTQNLAVVIDNTGNITSRTEAGTTYPYTYDSVHKHAISQLGSPAVHTYTYDANGNMASRDGLSFTWASFNLPTALNGSGGVSATFLYGPDRQRKEQVSTYNAEGDSGTETTIYVFGLYEHESTPAQTHDKYFVQVPGGTQIIYDIQSVSGTQTTYITSDHLGSANLMINAAGSVLLRESYGAYGRRRTSNWAGNLTTTSSDYNTIASTTRRGYTDAFHEYLDNVTLVHMNGRVYDQVAGRFLSPDPVVTQVGDSQRGNPYSYVENRPLTVTDPTGLMPCQGHCFPIDGDMVPHKPGPMGWRTSGPASWGGGFDWGAIGGGASAGMQEAATQQMTDEVGQFVDALNAAINTAVAAAPSTDSAMDTALASTTSPNPQASADGGLSPASGSSASVQGIYVGFRGAGSNTLPDNQEISALGATLNAKMYDSSAVIGSDVSGADSYVLQQLQANPGSPVYIFGYSAGGDAAVQLAANLEGQGVPVAGMVLFDPHSALRLAGYASYSLPLNVGQALDISQQNPQTLPWNSNPFQGGTINFCFGCGSDPNINLTGTSVTHLNIVQTSMQNYAPQIYSVLGH